MGLIFDTLRYRTVKAVSRILFPSGVGGWGQGAWGAYDPTNAYWPFMRGTRINYQAEVGDLRNQTLVMAATRYVGRNVATARLKVVEKDQDNKEKEIADHPLTKITQRPNPYYAWSAFLSGLSLSWICKGTGYAIKARGTYGNVLELYYEPATTIRPVWSTSGADFVAYYELYRDGRWGGSNDQRLDPRDVICWRDGIDPETREGINGTASLLREYYADQQAAHFMARMMRNGLVPPVVAILGDKERPFSDDADHSKLRRFQGDLVERMSGDRAGEAMAVSGAVDIKQLGFDYSKFGFRDIRQIPEERFCAVMGISPHSLHLGASTGASTFSNVQQFLQADYRGYILPFQKIIAQEFQNDPDFLVGPGQLVVWDYSQVPEMQGDINAEWTRLNTAYLAGTLKRSEIREAMGYKYDPDLDDIYSLPRGATLISPDGEIVTESAPAPVVNQPPRPGIDQPANPVKARRAPTEKEIDGYGEHWSDTVPPKARELFDAKVKANGHAG